MVGWDTTGYFANGLKLSWREFVAQFRQWKLGSEMVTQIKGDNALPVCWNCSEKFLYVSKCFLHSVRISEAPVQTPCAAQYLCLMCERAVLRWSWAGSWAVISRPVCIWRHELLWPYHSHHKEIKVKSAKFRIWIFENCRDAADTNPEGLVSVEWRIVCESMNNVAGDC